MGRIANLLTRWAEQRQVHRYLSTSCLHGDHKYCQSERGAVGDKTPAQCKFCKAPCVCLCHRGET